MAWTKIILPQSFFLGVSRRRGGKLGKPRPEIGSNTWMLFPSDLIQSKEPSQSHRFTSNKSPTDSPPHRCVVQCDPCHHNRQQQSWATSLAASVPKPEPRRISWVKIRPTNQQNYPILCWGPGVFHPTAWCLWEGIEKLLDDWMVEVKLVDLNPKKQAYVKEMIFPRNPQHTPGTYHRYHRPSTICLWSISFHLVV